MSWFKLEVILAMLSYAALIGLFLMGRKRAKAKAKKCTQIQDVSDITVIVPFRNESNNLTSLLSSLENLKVFPVQFIFVNDHSDDDFEKHFSNRKFPFELLHLKDNEKGKKAAILAGVSASHSKYILTWDADIEMNEDYFVELSKWQWTDLTILPVEMRGSKFVSGFFAMDYQLQSQANVSFSGFLRPITASGANLLFLKSAFLAVAESRNDHEIASGDDQFLLKAMREQQQKISLLTNEKLKVRTTAPETLPSGMSQRVRWLGKTTKVGDSLANRFGAMVFLVQIGYYSFAFYQTFIGDWGATIMMVLIKGELDAFLTTYKFQEQFNTLQVFVYQLLYPFYILVLLLLSVNKKYVWKGRSSHN
jgi:glycosyltransferase involved in cell wall biosynthesis